MTVHLPSTRDRDDWQLAIWNLPDDFVSRAQKLQLMTMIEARFNAFDPFRVVGDLLRHRDRWRGVVMDRAFPVTASGDRPYTYLSGDLIPLRDVESGHWNVDTLYLLIDSDQEAALRRLIDQWSADEVHVIEGEAVNSLLGAWGDNEGQKVVRVWWD
jgi:hypothetical protein